MDGSVLSMFYLAKYAATELLRGYYDLGTFGLKDEFRAALLCDPADFPPIEGEILNPAEIVVEVRSRLLGEHLVAVSDNGDVDDNLAKPATMVQLCIVP